MCRESEAGRGRVILRRMKKPAVPGTKRESEKRGGLRPDL